MTLSPVEGHRVWARTYDADLNPVLALEFRILSGVIGSLAGKVVVDAACGTGRWLVEARRRGGKAVGLDLCAEMLDRARSKPGLGGRLAQADVGCLPLRDGCADVVLCGFCLAYVESLDVAVRELARVVKPGGCVIASDVHPLGCERGWSRSFRSNGAVYDIQQRPYTTEQLLTAGSGARLELLHLLEPRFEEPEREIFRRAGKQQSFEEAREISAVLIARWKRLP